MSILLSILLVFYVLVALLMILVILMQRPKSEGLGAAFGGGVTENIFGAQTTNVLTKITGWLAGTFFALTFALSVLYAHRTTAPSGLRQELMKTESNAPALPQGQPGPAAAVATPGAATSPAPTGDEAATNAKQMVPADQAVAITPAAAPAEAAPATEPSASAQPTP